MYSQLAWDCRNKFHVLNRHHYKTWRAPKEISSYDVNESHDLLDHFSTGSKISTFPFNAPGADAGIKSNVFQ